MNEKILIWLDIGLTQFAISKFLKEKLDCELYSIIDCNDHLKKFYSTQQLVKFSKTWFYRDYVSKDNQTIDIKYLENFEKKYNINLWNLSYTDRIIYNYNPYYTFSKKEILSILESDCKLFESVLDEINPNFLIIRSTDYHQNTLLHDLCKSRGIRVLTLSHPRFGYRALISTDVDKIDESFEKYDHAKIDDNRTFDELGSYVYSYTTQNQYMKQTDRVSKWLRIKAGMKFLLFVCNNKYRSYYANSGRTRLKVLSNEGGFFFKRLRRKIFLDKHSFQDISNEKPFVYFPLHVEPERSISISAPFFTNQIEVITCIAKSLPVTHTLCVKEHPAQAIEGWREISFYKKILDLHNVRLIHPSVSNESMLKNCSLVITIAGTTGLEATFFGKPSISFTDVIYSDLKSVFRNERIEDLPQLITKALTTKVELDDLKKFVNYVEKNTFEYDIIKMAADWVYEFFYGGFLKDVEIDEEKMKIFLESHKTEFKILANEHLKKINNVRNNFE